MPKVKLALTNFSQGEMSPLMMARSDIAAYRNGAARLLNRLPLSQGGTKTRPGTRWFAALPAWPAILIPFVFSADQRYLVALADGRADIWTPAGTHCGTLTGPWTAAMLPTMGWAQTADTLLLFHQTMKPQRILRTSAVTFSVGAMPVERAPLGRMRDPAITMSVSAVGAAGVHTDVTFSGAGFLSSAWVGRDLSWKNKRMRITGVSSPTLCDAEWLDATSSLQDENGDGADDFAAPTTNWLEEAWSDAFGYPGTGAFVAGRLWLGGSPALPNGIWGSRSGAYFSWDTGEAADGDAIVETIAAGAPGTVLHMLAGERVMILTDSGVWYIPSSDNKPPTPSNVSFRQISETGAGRPRAWLFDNSVMFVDYSGRIVQEALYNLSLDTLQVAPNSLLAEHLIREPTCATTAQPSSGRPTKLAIMRNGDGTLAVLHNVRSENVVCWVPWETDGAFMHVCAVTQDIFTIALRNGVYTVELFVDDAAPLDCAARATSGSKARAFPGFAHLAGRTVRVTTRGHDIGDLPVSGGGVISLPDTVPDLYEIEAGYAFEQIIRPMPAAFDLQDGPARQSVKRLLAVHAQVDRAGMLTLAGRDLQIAFQGDDFDTPPDPFTGTLKVRTYGISKEAQFDLTVPQAVKVTVLALTREMIVGDVS
ncbi:hypothetical protein M0638_22225 [Roseomonas sp. NAR14]|uniref:Uncharacterized protein n=1 Tax=Roseomonas acroporae TaxID=2937791 RepID=A0A9X1YJ41_9PROT|nr:hypothetical protein [Roseomonas acroporae]MCK8787096.1 hypothetical protein [Roseomonas acroporae]